jgi:hypothetical protein
MSLTYTELCIIHHALSFEVEVTVTMYEKERGGPDPYYRRRRIATVFLREFSQKPLYREARFHAGHSCIRSVFRTLLTVTLREAFRLALYIYQPETSKPHPCLPSTVIYKRGALRPSRSVQNLQLSSGVLVFKSAALALVSSVRNGLTSGDCPQVMYAAYNGKFSINIL